MIRLVSLGPVTLCLVAACGASPTTTTALSSQQPVDAPVVTGTTSTSEPAPTSTQPMATSTRSTAVPPPTTTSVPPTTTTVLAGEPWDLFVPAPSDGSVVGVANVKHDDVLNVRSGPSVGFDVITTLEPLRMGILGTGDGWILPSGAIWWKIDVDGMIGWANSGFLTRFAAYTDITDRVGPMADSATMLELGQSVAAAVASESIDVTPLITLVAAPGDVADDVAIFDLFGLADDSVEGQRLRITGGPAASGFQLLSVESSPMCARGGGGGIGLCP